jgi:hypothetical protein
MTSPISSENTVIVVSQQDLRLDDARPLDPFVTQQRRPPGFVGEGKISLLPTLT